MKLLSNSGKCMLFTLDNYFQLYCFNFGNWFPYSSPGSPDRRSPNRLGRSHEKITETIAVAWIHVASNSVGTTGTIVNDYKRFIRNHSKGLRRIER